MTQMLGIDAIMRALADGTRRAVFERIAASDEISVAGLTRASDVTQSAVSQHLKLLKQAGLVAERRQGRNVFYSARPEGLAPLFDWLSHYDIFWHQRFGDLRMLLKQIDP